MAQPGFIFGEGTADTYESLQAKRKTAERLGLAAMRTPQNLGEGLSSLGQAIAYRRLMGQADRGEAAGKAAYDEKRQSVLGMLMGGQMGGMGGGGAMPPSGPATPSAFATPNPAGLPPEIISAVDRVDSPIPEQFSKIESTYGLPAGYLDRTYMIESNGNPNAQNPNSSAGGGFQFIDSTAKQYGLTDKTDLAASADAAARLAADNAKALRAGLGREPTAAELYLAHQQGAGGALKLLTNPNAPAASLVGGDAVGLNGGDPSMTGGAFASLWTNKFGGSPMSTPGAGIPGITELLADPYATEADKMVLGMLLQQQMEAMQPADPMQALELERAQLEIDQMRNPQAEPGWTDLTNEQEAAMGLDTSKAWQRGPDNQLKAAGDGGVNVNVGGGPAPQMPGQKAADTAYAPTYVEWTQGGGADLANQISTIEGVADRLESGKENLTGPLVGRQPDWLGSVTAPAAVAAREDVESVVQRNLRLLLGSQFTQAEGDRLIARAYNPALPEAENAKRLRRLAAGMRAASEARQSQAQYYETNGTITGWEGKVWTKEDFEAAIESDNAAAGEDWQVVDGVKIRVKK